MKLKINLRFIVLVLILCPMLLLGQRTITGTITDSETGETLIGASIAAPGTAVGTITDIDGTYSIVVPAEATQIEISYTGYTAQTINLSETPSNVIDIQLVAGSMLDEIVVIGYGEVKREDLTGSVQTVGSKDFNKGAITSPQELLAGKIAGVQITTNSGAPGDGAVIRIRGGSSLSASNDPLIVVDGVPIDNGGISGSRNTLNAINPSDIESYTVLKDASATAIYGSRASNGVILITTKKGSSGKVKINYTANFSFSDAIEQLDVLSADDFRTLINQEFTDGHPAPGILGSENTNWQDEIFETALGTDHNLSFSGTSKDNVPYRLSFGYTNRNGILKTDKFERNTFALNLSPNFMEDRLQVNIYANGMFSKNQFADRGAIGSAAAFDPTQPIRDENSPFGGYFTWTDVNGNPNGLAPTNPLALLNLKDDNSEVTRLIANASADYRFGFLPELRANLKLGYDYSKGDGAVFIPSFASFATDVATGGGVNNRYHQNKENKLLEFYLNYVKESGIHKVDLMGGYSWQRFFFEDRFRNSNLAGTPAETTSGENSGELFLLSLFGRLNYSIDGKYLFTFTLRRDGSSRFAPDNRWGLFPAAAFAMKVLDNQPGILNNLKLRLGYGVTGQQDIGGFYEHLPRYKAGFENAQYQFGDTFVTTLRPQGYDANIKWEETTTYNIGIDFGLFDQRIHGSFEYYIRETEDLLNFVPVPAGTNLTNFINTNVGSLENKGYEITLNFVPVKNQDITWDFGLNATRNENEITKLIASDDPNYQGVFVGGIAGGVGNTIQIHRVGNPGNSFFVFEQVYDEQGIPVEGLYVDRNGDGVVTPDDRYIFEQPAPDYFFGFFSNVSYRNFELSFAGRANVGNYVYNNVQSDQAFLGRLYHPTNYLLNIHGSYAETDFQVPEYLSDHFIQEASFLRIDHITLSYYLENAFRKSGSLTFTATLQNPLLITDYTGVDPEIFRGIDGNIYPRTRTFVFGVNANF